MIVLPDWAIPNGASPQLMDFGIVLRPATGAAVTRIDRPGNRFQVQFSFPPMKADKARLVVSRLIAAKSDGLRIEYPLLGVKQGSPGSPVVDGTSAAGTSLPLRGLNPGYTAKEGFWLTVIDADGTYYLHNVRANVVAGSDGKATLTVSPMLRSELADGATVLLGKPMVEGLVTSDASWSLPTNHLIEIGFTLEEAA